MPFAAWYRAAVGRARRFRLRTYRDGLPRPVVIRCLNIAPSSDGTRLRHGVPSQSVARPNRVLDERPITDATTSMSSSWAGQETGPDIVFNISQLALNVQYAPRPAIPIQRIVGSSKAARCAGEFIHIDPILATEPKAAFCRRAGPITKWPIPRAA